MFHRKKIVGNICPTHGNKERVNFWCSSKGMNHSNIPRIISVIPHQYWIDSNDKGQYFTSSLNENSKWRTSWNQSSAVIRVLHFTKAVWNFSSSSRGSGFRDASDVVSLMDIRGGCRPAGMVTCSCGDGNGWRCRRTFNRCSTQGSKAPSILNIDQLPASAKKKNDEDIHPKRCCSSPSPRGQIS